jgi:hypothetical protein
MTVIQPMLPLHECAAKPLQDPAESIAETAAADPIAAESTVEPLHSAADPAGSGAALTEICCLFVRF